MNGQFSFADLLALIGLLQSVYLIVYVLFRAGSWRNVIVPTLCFLVLALSFTGDFATPRFQNFEEAELLQNFIWILLPAVSALLIGQVADFGRLPTKSYWITLILPIIAGSVGGIFFKSHDLLITLGSIAGCLCFLSLWAGRRSFANLREDKQTKGERYWLILSFIIMNVLIIFVSLVNVSGYIKDDDFVLIRDVLGIGMVYLASTSLLRIYPQSIKLVEKSRPEKELSAEDRDVVAKIKNLIELDKVYQEANFSRADLARELNISEANVSRIISAQFDKSLPQLINESRIKDSLRLLEQTDAGMAVIAEQVGFSSLPTFNRVFKDIMNMSPSEYRQHKKETQKI